MYNFESRRLGLCKKAKYNYMTHKKHKLYLQLAFLVKDKIFQPFFTTKPTSQGTGLGLFLAYDIVKAHCRELKVETKMGEGSQCIIQLPT